ncbi:phosphatase PAP2 family protein [Streptomyces sp. NPDC014894]|uniref:phosphatase PAP2 family protein n=1 Tax=unclassified Streptomyces TaxID=2593676 RepID=UPI0036FF8079
MDSSITRGLYRDITEFAASTPQWVQKGMEIWTEAGILIFGVLFVAVWWRARGGSTSDISLAVLAPLGTAVGYVVSESLKTFFDEERPCRTVTEAAASIATCPPYGDWSFPSNHSAIAGAAAVALLLARPRLAWLTVPMGLSIGYSRVFLGVHYPHDVIVGLLVGGVAAAAFMLLLAGPAAKLFITMRTSGNGLVLWFAGPGRR